MSSRTLAALTLLSVLDAAHEANEHEDSPDATRVAARRTLDAFDTRDAAARTLDMLDAADALGSDRAAIFSVSRTRARTFGVDAAMRRADILFAALDLDGVE